MNSNEQRVSAGLADVVFSYAPAKIILGGEHAVVYGQPAIAMAIDRGIRVAVCKLNHKNGPILRAVNHAFVGEVKADPQGQGPAVLRTVLAKLSEVIGEAALQLHMSVDTDVPVGCGLGSSAALSVALVRGIHRFLGRELAKSDETALAFELEKIFHGNPSGIDHTVISNGGLICYKKNDCAYEQLASARTLRFAVGLAGPHGGTARAVSLLKERARRHSKIYDNIFSLIGSVVLDMKSAIIDGKLAALGELMDVNQGLLNSLGLSTPKLEALCSIARERGALGAKLTGAGCGGAVIALVDGDPQDIVHAFQAAGYLAFAAQAESIG